MTLESFLIIRDNTGMSFTRIMIKYVLALLCVCTALQNAAAVNSTPGGTLGPNAMAVSSDRKTLYIACLDSEHVAVLNLHDEKVTNWIKMPSKPTGLVVDPKTNRLFVTCAGPKSTVEVINLTDLKTVESILVGHTAMGPSISPDGKRLYVCNRFDNNVSVIDLDICKETCRVAVVREPVASAVTPDGSSVLILNHQPFEPSNGPLVRAKVSFINSATLFTTSIYLPDGSINLHDVCISPDGKLAFITHGLANYSLVASQVSQGWMNMGSISVIDLEKQKFDSNSITDDFSEGAASPWGVDITPDGKTICFTHSGTHDMSVADITPMLKAIRIFHEQHGPMGGENLIRNARKRIKLPGNGPRALKIIDRKAYIAEYFTDTIAVVDIDHAQGDDIVNVRSILLGFEPINSLSREGERLFHDATLCLENWQSCSSCHPDARSDTLNWDLMNDGVGTAKNTKSLLYAHRTPPTTATGIRASAEESVRAGLQHILFMYGEHEREASAIDSYLQTLRPVPSPYLVDGKLSKAAERGRKLFESETTGCATCHPAPMYTDLSMHDVPRSTSYDHAQLDTPTLIECWRTAPYLYNGRFITVRDTLVKGMHGNELGGTENLTSQEIDDLVEFVLSL